MIYEHDDSEHARITGVQKGRKALDSNVIASADTLYT
jgi:hypothetical protein